MFGREIALRLGGELEANEELAHARAAEEWRGEVEVQVSNVVLVVELGECGDCGATRYGALVDAHRVRERAREEVVVALGHDGEDLREGVLLLTGEAKQRRYVAPVREH